MKCSYFGTDGIRGLFGGPVINPKFAYRLGVAAGFYAKERTNPGEVCRVVVGRDTRGSGVVLEKALALGLSDAGCQVSTLGVLPTPAVSLAVINHNACIGVVITASHNPAEDNGIKFFAESGGKLTDSDELLIERKLSDVSVDKYDENREVSVAVLSGEDDYMTKAQSILLPNSLSGWSIVLDTANGSSYKTSPLVMRALGAEVFHLGGSPDGTNINNGVGSEYPEKLSEKVRQTNARVGVAHDGDADRVVLCDEEGVILDGDEVMTILALHALKKGELKYNTLVVTVMSNIGVRLAL
ncbi:MAG: phosphoglucosamine mutase, partial [Opitutaceae bacterium]|nr:phosphoglucosamine mutase [Opitutaceae bacterium]